MDGRTEIENELFSGLPPEIWLLVLSSIPITQLHSVALVSCVGYSLAVKAKIDTKIKDYKMRCEASRLWRYLPHIATE